MTNNNLEHIWKFTYFGTSTSEETNRCIAGGSLASGISLCSCTIKADGSVDKKGGKYPASEGYDGISFYYTRIDASNENFVLQADVTIDYINPTPDGQEGAALMVRDSLGEHGEAECAFFTNSAAVIATKLNYTDETGTITEVKNGVGYRMITGVSSASQAPDGQVMKTVAGAFGTETVKAGETYRLALAKTNTGYHASYILNGGERKEHILYGPEELMKIDKDYLYVGFSVARGCNATFHNISFAVSDPTADAPAAEEPVKKLKADIQVLSPAATGRTEYQLRWKANVDGTVNIFDENNKLLTENLSVTANTVMQTQYSMVPGEHGYRICFTPLQEAGVEITHAVSCRVMSGDILYVSAEGLPEAEGTKSSPLDIGTAFKFASAGQTIMLKAGTYYQQLKLIVPRGTDGTAGKPIVVRSDGGRAVIDFMKQGGGFELAGNYWELHDIDICHSADGTNGLLVSGSGNLLSGLRTYANGNTGLQLSGNADEEPALWPSDNQVRNCASYNNSDEAREHADGFAAKLACGKGNVFSGCVSAYNADDGYDLFSKIAIGSIGVVTIKNCVAFRNGYLYQADGSIRPGGTGNGFKLGGSGLSGHHILKDCLSYENRGKGIDSNSCPDIEIYDNISYNNGDANIALYPSNRAETSFIARGNISFRCGMADVPEKLVLIGQNEALIYNESNYFYNPQKQVYCNCDGQEIHKEMFISLDTGKVPSRREDGSLELNGLLALKKR